MISFAFCWLLRCLLDGLSMFRTYGCNLMISFAVCCCAACGRSWGDLGRSWAWVALEPLLSTLGRSWGAWGRSFGHSWGVLGLIVEHSKGAVGCPWGHVEHLHVLGVAIS